MQAEIRALVVALVSLAAQLEAEVVRMVDHMSQCRTNVSAKLTMHRGRVAAYATSDQSLINSYSILSRTRARWRQVDASRSGEMIVITIISPQQYQIRK
eukprot:9395518-Ditylum_brightwellii.AAC.1